MFRRPTPFSLFTAGLLTALTASAQPPVAPPPVQASQDQPRISAHIAAAIREKLPAYTAPVPAPAPVITAKETEPAPVETGKIAILPKVVVYGARQPKLSERDLATKLGLANLLLKLYPGASTRGQDPSQQGPTPNYASFMLAEDERLKQMSDLERTVENLRIAGDLKGSKELDDEITRAFFRRHDWRTDSMVRSANNNRY